MKRLTSKVIAISAALSFVSVPAAGQPTADHGVTSVLVAPRLTPEQAKVVRAKLAEAGLPPSVLHLSGRGEAGGEIAIDVWQSGKEAERYWAAMKSGYDAIKLPLDMQRYRNNHLSIPNAASWYANPAVARSLLLTTHIIPKLTPEQIDALHVLAAKAQNGAPKGAPSLIHVTSFTADGGFYVIDLWASVKDFEAQRDMVSKQIQQIDSPYTVYHDPSARLGKIDIDYSK